MYFPKACQMRPSPSCKVIIKDSSICTSTACEGYETLYVCMTMKCEPSWIVYSLNILTALLLAHREVSIIIPGNLNLVVWQDQQQCDKD